MRGLPLASFFVARALPGIEYWVMLIATASFSRTILAQLGGRVEVVGEVVVGLELDGLACQLRVDLGREHRRAVSDHSWRGSCRPASGEQGQFDVGLHQHDAAVDLDQVAAGVGGDLGARSRPGTGRR
jgi:hypothetical protein